LGRFLQHDPYDEFASGYIGMGDDPANLVDPTGGCTSCTLPEVVVTAARRAAPTALQASKVVNTTATTLKVVKTTYQVYQNSDGETFETTNPGLGSNTSYNGQSWDRVGTRPENLHIPDDGLPSHMSGDRWQDRLKYFYQATHDLPDGASWDDAWDLAENRWNYNHKFNVANLHYTSDAFWSGSKELLYTLPTAIEPTDGPEILIGAGIGKGLLKGGGLLFAKKGARKAATKGVRHALPALDATGKVHGKLLKVKDFGKYSEDELQTLLGELKQSVQKRIEVTSKMGRDRAHGQRQGAEQDLIKSLEKYLGN